MRFLIYLLLFYLAYRALKGWMAKNLPRQRPDEELDGHSADDIMLKDPFCGVYFPKKEGVRLLHKGQEWYFCSVQCRDSFLSKQKQEKAGER
jgi:YHS domain-containing protein